MYLIRFIAVKTWQRTIGFFASYRRATAPTQFTNRTRRFPNQIAADENRRQHCNQVWKFRFHSYLWEVGITVPATTASALLALANDWSSWVYMCFPRQYVCISAVHIYSTDLYRVAASNLRFKHQGARTRVTWGTTSTLLFPWPEAEIHLSNEMCLVGSEFTFIRATWFDLQQLLEQRKTQTVPVLDNTASITALDKALTFVLWSERDIVSNTPAAVIPSLLLSRM